MEGPRRHRRHTRVREAAAARHGTSGASSRPQTDQIAGVLLDTDVVIEILRGRVGISAALISLERSGVRTYCCAVTWAEICAGIRPGEEVLAEAFLEARGDVLLDATTGRRAGGYLARFAASHGLELPDAMIAAAASTAGLSLWTSNRRHYPMPDVEFYTPPR